MLKGEIVDFRAAMANPRAAWVPA